MDPLSSGADLRALQVLSMEAFKDAIKAHEMAGDLITDEPLQLLSPEHLGQSIDLKA